MSFTYIKEIDTPYGHADEFGLINLYTVNDVEDVVYEVLREEWIYVT